MTIGTSTADKIYNNNLNKVKKLIIINACYACDTCVCARVSDKAQKETKVQLIER